MTYFTNSKINPNELIRKFRKLKGMTQQQLADQLGYSARQIMRIEAGTKEISKEAMKLLSDVFNIDLHQYINLSNSFESVEVYENYTHLRKLVEANDYNAIRENCERIRNSYDDLKGELLQLVLHSKAILQTHIEKNYTESNKFCFEALDVFNYCDYISSLNNGILNEMSYPALFLLAYNYSMIGENNLSDEITSALYDHFENIVFSSTVPIKSDMYHMRKYYIIVTNNLADQYYKNKKYSDSLELIDKAISLSNKFTIHIYMFYLLELKFRNLYMLGDIKNAKKFFRFFHSTCEISDNLKYFYSIIDELKLSHSLLFDNHIGTN